MKFMFPNLRAEMARKRITNQEIAKKCLGVRLSTVSSKMHGKSDFTFREAIAIKKYLGVDTPLEELFYKEDQVTEVC